ncbi:MAG: NAD(P)-dependent dehydrogenase (short-subunit alcohol dehydrogenase family) [Lentimonas sp.]|jgi:NAD(P)-dependent dehydrogenase (short-subunit alcohol dehydrogenase family)
MDLKLNNKLALISGSTAGIGFSIAKTLAEEGADVIVNGRKQASVDGAVAEIKASATGTVHGFAGDLSKSSVANELHKAFPEVDILVNNLGIFEPVPFTEISDEDWMRFFDVNVLSGVRLSRLYLPRMKAENWGRIIFISSESGVNIPEEMIHYGMTKSAQISVARGLAASVAGTGITVNSVLPGPTKSRGVKTFVEQQANASGKSVEEVERDFFKDARPSSLIQRFASTDEVATTVAYIASPLASATTGAPIRVEGGIINSAY